MSSTYRAFISKMGGTNPAEYVGHEGEIFWNPTDGVLKLSDGSTPGGISITSLSNGFQARNETATVTASAVAADAIANIDITGHKGYILYSITADKPCRIRLYSNDANRTADANRIQGTPPTANAGLIAEAVFVSGDTVSFSPGVFGFNEESTPTTTIPVAVTNNGNSTEDIAVSLTVLKLEQG